MQDTRTTSRYREDGRAEKKKRSAARGELKGKREKSMDKLDIHTVRKYSLCTLEVAAGTWVPGKMR
jgi:hypothetical protein